MRRTTKVMAGVSVALALGVVGQIAVYRFAPSTLTMQASWKFHPKDTAELQDHAQDIVLAQVVDVARGQDIVTRAPGEPGGADRIPTQRVTVKVMTSYKGKTTAGDKLTLFQTGGTVLPPAPAPGEKASTDVQQFVLEGDPPYQAGEQYMLMLEPGPEGTLRPVSPEGRYLYNKDSGTLTAVVHDAVADGVASQRLAALERTLRAA